jgi:hypothetical protein
MRILRTICERENKKHITLKDTKKKLKLKLQLCSLKEPGWPGSLNK